ncbi:MAG: M48 family metalloprotease [Candidatus Methanoplasma sp.]|jgi:heat shock protein HtpX|nr:M48 family metalloprotease [Candidatus Methanoplasma sp.]
MRLTWQIRTAAIFALMSMVMAAIGILVGVLVGSVWIGLAVLLALAMAMNLYAFFFSKKHALRANGARIVSESEEPRLYGIVRGVADKAGVPMPEVGVIETNIPNAFATGRNPRNAAVVATRALLDLRDDELEGVIAHEIAHVRNRDILVMSVASTMAAILTFLSHHILYATLFNRNRDAASIAIAVAVSITVPIAAMLIQLGISRNREYLADETGAMITGNPRALARALRRIESGVLSPRNDYDNSSYADMWISDPVRKKKSFITGMFRTHPPMDDRIARLNALADRMEGAGGARPHPGAAPY